MSEWVDGWGRWEGATRTGTPRQAQWEEREGRSLRPSHKQGFLYLLSLRAALTRIVAVFGAPPPLRDTGGVGQRPRHQQSSIRGSGGFRGRAAGWAGGWASGAGRPGGQGVGRLHGRAGQGGLAVRAVGRPGGRGRVDTRQSEADSQDRAGTEENTNRQLLLGIL